MPVSVQCPNPDCHASFDIAPGDAPRFRRCPQCGWDLFAETGSGRISTLSPDPDQVHLNDGDRPPLGARDPLVGETIGGRYTILQVLGRGGMGAVYLAIDNRLGGRKVAVKVPTLSDDRDADFLKRLEREAHIAAQFQHPNICPIHDVGTHDGRPFLVLAYIEGTSLADYLERRTKPFDVVQAVKLVAVVAQAMHKAHETGIIHRDLKPDNIMLTREGRPIVMDFGLSKRADSGEKLTSAGKAFGTPAYMPIEQYRDVAAIDHRADIYSLGVTLYQLLTGRLPYRGSLYQILAALQTTDPPPPSTLRPEVDPELESICLKAMAKEAADRYDSMRAFADALNLWLKRTEPPLLKPPPPEKTLSPWLKRTEPIPPEPPPPEKTQTSGRGRGAGTRGLVALGVFGLMALLGIVVYVATNHGTVQITVDDPDAVVRVDGSTIHIEKIGEPITLTLRAGAHELLATRGEMVVKTRQFSLRRGGRESVRVEYVPPPARETVTKTETPVAPPESKPQPAEPPPTPVPAVATTATPAPQPTPPAASPTWTSRSTGMTFALIPTGDFVMGSADGDDDEKPPHPVKISKSFYLSIHEVTQGEYKEVMGNNPSWFSAGGDGKDKVAGQSTDRHPVEQVSWKDAIAFCNKLSGRDGLKPYYRSEEGEPLGGDGYRLPTEAEWEYACRARSTTKYSFGDDESRLKQYAWYDESYSTGTTHPVGKKDPNAFGLYDMHGNVWEWCWDWYDKDYYNRSSNVDPMNTNPGTDRVLRGGSWLYVAAYLRSSFRAGSEPANRDGNIGFRLARTYH
jgi:formylglycine-generating enzyme required for sulfatase activity/serine/threonine protein kinase